MSRKKLKKQIQELDQQLAVEIGLLKLDGRERLAAIQRVPMLWWIAGAVGVGLLTGRMSADQGSISLASKGITLFRLISFALPGGLSEAAAAPTEL